MHAVTDEPLMETNPNLFQAHRCATFSEASHIDCPPALVFDWPTTLAFVKGLSDCIWGSEDDAS